MRRYFSIALLFVLPCAVAAAEGTPNQVTILYDAFGQSAGMTKDWGFSALIEYGGRRILFDTGNDADIFARNVKAAGVDLSRLDFVVISHRHLDHTAGLSYLQEVNPRVKIYAPKEPFGAFGSSLPSRFYRKDESLPARMRYYDGDPPETMRFGTAWAGAGFETVDKTFEAAPGVYIISLVSDAPGTRELRELSLAIRTPQGLALIVGCSHPGIERIVAEAGSIDPRIHVVFGGMHLPAAPDAEITRVAASLHDELHVETLAPGHCTGEPAFAMFRKTWGERYRYAGVGEVLALP